MITSVSEKDIVLNHKTIIMNMIDDYNECVQLAYGEELCYPDYANWAIVEELLLCGTAHGGMTSSIEKCREIGLDPWDHAFPKKVYVSN